MKRNVPTIVLAFLMIASVMYAYIKHNEASKNLIMLEEQRSLVVEMQNLAQAAAAEARMAEANALDAVRRAEEALADCESK